MSYVISGVVYASVVGGVLAGLGQGGIALVFFGVIVALVAAISLLLRGRPAKPAAAPAPVDVVHEPAAVAAPVADVEVQVVQHAPAVETPAEAPFPIDGYAELTVAKIVPLLADLAPADLAAVRAAEAAGAGRTTVLKKIDALLVRAEKAGAPA